LLDRNKIDGKHYDGKTTERISRPT
jgi:hypothetical protein